MKKIIFVLTFFCCLGGGLFAQETGFRFGFQTSPSWSWLRSSDKRIEGAGANWGLKMGLLAEVYFAPNYAITSGIGFGFNQGGTLQNGYRDANYFPKSVLDFDQAGLDSLSENAKIHYRLRYIEVPLSLRIRGGAEDSKMQFFAELPIFTLGFRAKALADFRGTDDDRDSEDENIQDDINALSISWGLGGGIEYELATNTRLAGGIYWQQQFTDVDSDKGTATDPRNGQVEKLNGKTTGRQLSLRIAIFF